jgi:hypothetical protein
MAQSSNATTPATAAIRRKIMPVDATRGGPRPEAANPTLPSKAGGEG